VFEIIQNGVRLCVDARGNYKIWVGKKKFIVVSERNSVLRLSSKSSQKRQTVEEPKITVLARTNSNL
jgi:hypothetical protein